MNPGILKRGVRAIPMVSYGLLGLVFCWNLLILLKYAVNVPFWDEWEAVMPGALSKELSWSWLIRQHNEHRILPTKLLTWFLYLTTSWNLRTQQIFNLLIYSGLVGAFWALAKRTASGLPDWVIAGFLCFCFTTVAHENHAWAFQSQFHFTILFFVLGAEALFRPHPSTSRLVAGSLLLGLSMFSFSSGIPSSAAVGLVFGLSQLGTGKGAIRPVMLVGSLLIAILALWFTGFERPAGHPNLAFPHQWQFWETFLNLVSFGFGFETVSTVIGVMCFGLVTVPLAGWFWKDRKNLTSNHWLVLAVFGGICAALMTVTLGRAGFGIGAAKTSRYAEFALFLIPIALCGWWNFLSNRPRLRAWVLAGIWLFCFAGSASDWNPRVYQEQFQKRIEGVACIESYFQKQGNGNCPTLYPAPIGDRLERAKQLNLSFVR